MGRETMTLTEAQTVLLGRGAVFLHTDAGWRRIMKADALSILTTTDVALSGAAALFIRPR